MPLSAPGSAGAAAPLSWSTGQPIGGAVEAISCPTSSFCAAVDGTGEVFTGDPLADSAWSTTATAASSLDSVSCASASMCVAVGAGKSDNLVTSAGWSVPASIDSQPIEGVSCPSESFCIAVDQAGDVLSSSDPTDAVRWSEPASIDGAPLRSISCASESLCVAVDQDGGVLASSRPTAGASSWQHVGFDSSSPLADVSCAPSGLCAAVGGSGAVIASGDLESTSPTWGLTSIGSEALTGISCVSSGLCVAVEHGGGVRASDDVAGLSPGWSSSTIGAVEPSAISCLAEGFCVLAAGPKGEVSIGRLPAPVVATGGPSGVAQATASVAGTVNPEDAPLSSCRFEYGTSEGYGQSVPCASAPGPGSAAVEVSAAIDGLTPATAYHYRLVAASATGQDAGAVGTFTTTALIAGPLVHPAPYVTGVPAIGDRLSCNANIHGANATLAYAWWRDASPIAGASNQIYHIGPEDAGQHLQCEVTATVAAGSASARSAFVAVPAEGLPPSVGETVIGAARISGGKLELPVSCSPQADPACKLELRLTAVEMLRGGKLLAVAARTPSQPSPHEHSQSVTLLARKARVPAGKQRTILMALNATGRRLIAADKHLSARLTVEGTVIGVLSATLAREQVNVVGQAAHAGVSGRRQAHGAGRRR
jgi:hypothetical protein